jgi:hypothetical protein
MIMRRDFHDAEVGDVVTFSDKKWPVVELTDDRSGLFVKNGYEVIEIIYHQGLIVDENFNIITELNKSGAYIEKH